MQEILDGYDCYVPHCNIRSCSSSTNTSITYPTESPNSYAPGELVRESFEDVFIEFEGAKLMSRADTRRFELLSEEWYNQCFADRSRDVGVQDMKTTILVQNQTLTGIGNKIRYNQMITYIAIEENINPEQYLYLPFFDLTGNNIYSNMLTDNLNPSVDFVPPVAIPQIIGNSTVTNNTTSSPNGALIGGTVAAAILILLIGGVYFYYLKTRKNSSQQPIDESSSVNSKSSNGHPFQINEMVNSQALNVLERNDPGFKVQAKSTTTAAQGREAAVDPLAALQEPDGILLGEQHLPNFKDQVRNAHVAIAEAVPIGL